MTPSTARMRPGPRRKFTVALHSTVRHGARRAQRWRIVVHMGRTRLAAAMAALVVALSGCAAGAPANNGTPTPIDSRLPTKTFSGGAVGDATDPIIGPVFPLTLRRTGGVAGYDDTVILKADGTVLVTTRSIHGRECQLSGAQQKHLLSLLSTLRLVDATETPTAGGLGERLAGRPRGRRRRDQRRDRHRHHRPRAAAARSERPIARGGGWPGRVPRGRCDAVHPCRDRVHDPDQHGLHLTAVARRHLRAPVPNWRADQPLARSDPGPHRGEREFMLVGAAPGHVRARRVCPRRPRRRPRPGPRSSAPPPRGAAR